MLSNTVNVRPDERDWSLAIGVIKERKTESFDPGGDGGTAANSG